MGVWFALYGLHAVGNQVAYAVTGGIPVPMLFMLFAFGSIVVNFALAATFWRRAPSVTARAVVSPAS